MQGISVQTVRDGLPVHAGLSFPGPSLFATRKNQDATTFQANRQDEPTNVDEAVLPAAEAEAERQGFFPRLELATTDGFLSCKRKKKFRLPYKTQPALKPKDKFKTWNF